MTETSFRADLLATAPAWGSAFGLTAAATFWLAGVWEPVLLVHLASWLVIGLVLLAVGFVVALTATALVLTALLSLLALPARLAGRPTGLRELLAELWALPAHVLPGFWRALRRVRRPGLWGAAAGFVAGVVAFAVAVGLPTA